MTIKIRVQGRCLVRHQDCRRIFGGSRTCFVACPNSEEIALELEILRQKLREAKIEPYIAVDQRDFQKDIFCEKICTKIIESLFCIVILNDVKDSSDSVRKPNPNVYYEYGLMTAFQKKIIPVQFVGHSLAFNIQSLDTLKYTQKDFPRQIEEAIRMTLLDLDADQSQKEERVSESNFEWALDLMGLVRADDRYRLRHERILSNASLGFQAFNRPRDGRLFYVGIFGIEDTEPDVLLRAKMLTLRIKNYCDQIRNELAELRDSSGTRPRPMVDDRINELERLRGQFSQATLIIIKKDLVSEAKFSEAYKKSVEEINFPLHLEALDDRSIKKLLESW